jgi:uncharacterized membrane protein YqjE
VSFTDERGQFSNGDTRPGLEEDPSKPKQAEKSLGDLFGDLSSEFTDLLRTQLELAKVELRGEARKAGQTAGLFGGAIVAAYMALVLLSFAVAWALENVMDAGLAFFIVGAVYAIAAAFLYLRGRDRAKELHPIPKQTVDSVKEDVQWARQNLS